MKCIQKYYLALTIRMLSFMQLNHEKFPSPIRYKMKTSTQGWNSFYNFYRDLDL